MVGECQVCGRQSAGEGLVEGTRVPLCEKCSAYSSNFTIYKTNVVKKPKPGFTSYTPTVSKEAQAEFVLADDFGKKIMQARGKLNLSRKDLALKLFIQEKELEGFEQQKFKPSESIAKKMEFTLGISLREKP